MEKSDQISKDQDVATPQHFSRVTSVRDEDTMNLDSELATMRWKIQGKAEEYDAEAHNAQAAQDEGEMEGQPKEQGFPMLETFG